MASRTSRDPELGIGIARPETSERTSCAGTSVGHCRPPEFRFGGCEGEHLAAAEHQDEAHADTGAAGSGISNQTDQDEQAVA